MRRTAPIGLARHGGHVRNRDRARVPRRALDGHEDVLRVPQRVRRPTELERLPGVPRPAGVAPGAQREGDRVDRADRARARLDDRAGLAVPPEELLLSRHAEGLPDQPVRPPGVRRRAARDRGRRRAADDRRHARAHGGGHGQDDARGRRRADRAGRVRPRRLQPRRRAARRVCLRARPALGGGGARLLHRAPRDARGARRLGRADGGGLAPLRRQHLHPARGGDRARHQGRDQEPQLGALARTRAALRGGAAAGRARARRAARPGDPSFRRGDRRDAHAAFEGGGVRLPVLPRARPAAARTRPRVGEGAGGRAARAPGRAPRPVRGRARSQARAGPDPRGLAPGGGVLRGDGRARGGSGIRRELDHPGPRRARRTRRGSGSPPPG